MVSEEFCPKCIFEKEFLAGWDTNGASLDDLWKDTPLWQKQWCVWSASQAVLFEVAGQVFEEHGEERIAPLLQNLPFTDDVFPGKYETCIGEPPTTLTRERVRSTCPLNEATEILLHNRLLRRNVDPLMPRGQQVEALLQLEGGAEFRVSTSCSTEDNSDDTAGITSAVTSTSITAPAATPTTASHAAVLPPAAAFTPSSAAAAATAIDAAAEGNIDDGFPTAAAAGIAYDPLKKEDPVPASAAATDAFDTFSASADLFDSSAACTGCAAVYDLYFRYSGEEEETHPYLYNKNNKPSSSLYNNNNDPRLVGFLSNKTESKKRKRNELEDDGFYLKRLRYDNKPSCSPYDNNANPSSFLDNNNKDPRLVGFSAHKMESKKRKRNELQDDGFYLKRMRYD